MTRRRILAVWLPLAASWVLMTLEGPLIHGAIGRLPEAKTMLAAAGIVIGLEVTLESPVIMLLATSTALAKSGAAYRVLRRFTIHLNLALTVLAAALAWWTPLFDLVVRDAMGTPPPIADAVRPGLQVMVLWTAAIGWRRFQQGVLIRFGRTRAVGVGTGVRLGCGAACAVGLVVWGVLPGILVGACTWMAGVLAEAVFVHGAARSTVTKLLAEEGTPDDGAPDYAEVARFHAPLAATALLSLLAMPAVSAALARMPAPEESLAAWPVLFGVLLVFRSPGLSLPETVIALLAGPETHGPVRRFCRAVGTAASLLLLLVALTPLLGLFVTEALSVSRVLAEVVVSGALVAVLVPGLQAYQSWYRGALMTVGETGAVYSGKVLDLSIVVALLVAGVLLGAPGVPCAAVAVTVGMACESLYLARRTRTALNGSR